MLCHQQYMFLLLFWPPFHVVCPNNELVVFQPQTGTATDLVPVAIIITLILDSSYHICFNIYPWIIPCFPLPYPPPPPLVTVRSRITSICCTGYPSPLPAQNAVHLDINHTRHLPASYARLCALHRVPSSFDVYCVRLIPLCHPWPASWYLLDPGGFAHCGTHRILVPHNFPPCVLL